MAAHNRVVRLVRRPTGMVAREDFSIADEAIPQPSPGQVRVAVRYVSLDPAMRGWMNEARSYVPPVALGDVMRGYAAGIVEASADPTVKPGDAVTGLFGVQTHAVAEARHVTKVDTTRAPLERWIGGLGMPGQTAFFGVREVLKPQPGETLVVSAASGAVGSIVGQIARIDGARAVGIAGGADKCRFLVETLGFDAAVDYKGGRLVEDLPAACPYGIDAYFENVGGEILEAVLDQMTTFGRIGICGLISAYNRSEPPAGPRNLRNVLTRRLRIQGLLVSDWADRHAEASDTLARWNQDGRLVIREDVRGGGVDAYPEVLNLLFSGGNAGKLILEV